MIKLRLVSKLKSRCIRSDLFHSDVCVSLFLFPRTTWHRGTFPESERDDLVKPKFPANRFTSIEEESKDEVRTVESVGQRTDEGRDTGELRRRQKVEKMVIDSITRTS